MLDTGLPLWIRLQINEFILGLQKTMELCERRCRALQDQGHRNEAHKLADEYGAIDEYRMDAKYCAGQIVRLRDALEGRLTPEEQENGPWQEIPRDPKHLAEWAWSRPVEQSTPQPDTEVTPPRQVRLHDALADFTPRQRQVLIYCIGARWTPEATAAKLDLPVALVKRYLNDAKQKFHTNEAKH